MGVRCPTCGQDVEAAPAEVVPAIKADPAVLWERAVNAELRAQDAELRADQAERATAQAAAAAQGMMDELRMREEVSRRTREAGRMARAARLRQLAHAVRYAGDQAIVGARAINGALELPPLQPARELEVALPWRGRRSGAAGSSSAS